MFPTIKYDFSIKGEPPKELIVTDILRRIKISSASIKNYGAYDKYIVSDGETPEVISYKYYGTVNYYWIIMLINDLFDGLGDLPQNQYHVEQMIDIKYGEASKYAIHHYEDTEGNEINSMVSGNSISIFDSVAMQFVLHPISNFVTVTNYDYEVRQNEKHREIFLLKPIFISGVIKEASRLLKS